MAHLEEALRRLKFDDPKTRVLGSRFEDFIGSVFRKHPGVYGKERFEDIWSWNEWPDRENIGYGTDCGIDLVARQTSAYGGGFCAIQCKYRSDGSSVSTREVDSFLAEVGKGFVSSLLVTSAPVAKAGMAKIRNASPSCQVLYTVEMDDWVDDWRDYVESPESFEIPPPLKHELYDYQADALRDVVEGFRQADRGQLILPCGTGKSFVALRIAERVVGKGGRVLYLVPSIALVGQTMREWSDQRSIPLKYLGICSDPTTGRKASARVDLAGDLTELVMPVTTDPDRIKGLITAPVSPEAMQVVFSTYHSAKRIESAVEDLDEVEVFDLIICDEAHRTTGVGASDSASDRERSYYRIVHHDDCIPAAKRLYMTATPRVFTERAKQKLAELGENEDPDCYDMNDEAVYGKEFYRMSFGDAVEDGYLSNYEILVITASAEAYLRSMGGLHDQIVGSHRYVTLDDAIKLAGCWDALASPETTGVSPGTLPGEVWAGGGDPARSAIAFSNRVDTSKWVAENWQKIVEVIAEEDQQRSFLNLEVEHVDGSTPASERIKNLQRLETSEEGEGGARTCQIVSNARVLSEGVNVPSLDAVLFLDPRSSPIDITQQVGRVMRRAPGKEKGYIVIAVVVPEGDDPKKLLEASDWDVVWRVVKALRSHDERLEYYVNHEAAWENAPLRTRVSRLGKTEEQLKGNRYDRIIQLQLALNDAIASMVVDTCGDRNIYPTWGRRAATVCRRIQARVKDLTDPGGKCESVFQKFLEGITESVRRKVTLEEAQQMIAQHIVTIPVFDAMLGKNEFSQHNPVSKEIERLLEEFRRLGIEFDGEVKPLTRAYEGMNKAFKGAVSSSERVDILRKIYEGFFEAAMRDTVKRLGIVYTPVEIVDFMIRSVAAICEKEFGRSISSKNVNVLDPFVGTGTFLARLIEMRGDNGEYIIRDEDLDRKYKEELHANELVLLAYYIAALKIEEAKHARDEERTNETAEYAPFEKIVFTDTLHGSPRKPQLPAFLDENIKNRKKQDEIPMEVILSNPPWSAGMKAAGDDNPNIEYEDVSKRIKATYGIKHREITGKSGGKAFGNLYVKALRWATDRILLSEDGRELPAVIGFVHPNSLVDGTSLAGVRALVRDEFSDVYVVNLRGNAYKSGEEFRKEGDKIFGGGSRNGVQITFLVRNPEKDRPAVLHYAQVPDRMSLDEKFEWLENLKDITSSELEEVPVTPRHDWVNLSDGSYERLLKVCDTGKTIGDVAFTKHALGVTAGSDTYVYSFNRKVLEERMQRFIDAYNEARKAMGDDNSPERLSEVTRNTRLDDIKWADTLKRSLKRGERIEFEPGRIREVLYRPFTKLWLYEDARILPSVRTISAMFPRDDEVTNGGGGGVLADTLSDCDPVEQRQQHALPGVGSESVDGSSGDQGFAADKGDSKDELGGGGGGIPSNSCHNPFQQGDLRSSRDRMHRRPLRGRNSAGQSSVPEKAILLTGPSNMATFGVLVSGLLPDLHSMAGGQQTRTVPKQN